MAISPQEMAALSGMYENAGALQAREIANRYKLGQAELKNSMKIASMQSGDRRAAIEAEREMNRERIAQARLEMERMGIPRVEIERFVAESTAELARQELAFKREVFLEESGLARSQLQLDREQMERIGIPEMEIRRYTAQRQAELAEREFVEQQRQFGVNAAEAVRQFNVGASGYMGTPGQLTPEQQGRYQQIKARDAELRAAGQPGVAPADAAELAQYESILSGSAGPRAATLERERFAADEAERQRRYGLDVAQFGAQLASTPDRYFQAQRYFATEAPRLMGGQQAPAPAFTGTPTPGIATMGSYLSTGTPYGGPTVTPYGGTAPQYESTRHTAAGMASPGGPQAVPSESFAGAGGAVRPGTAGGAPAVPGAEVPGALGMAGTAEDDRYRQVAQIAKAVPPSPFDGLSDTDAAALRLMQSIYQKGLHQAPRGEIERLSASGRLGFLKSAGTVLGYDPEEEIKGYQMYAPSQGSAALA